jgi:hypothetical protein
LESLTVDNSPMSLRASLFALVFSAASLTQLGCSDVSYNPYVQNDGRRPIGKTLEADGPDAANDALSTLDARFENAYN